MELIKIPYLLSSTTQNKLRIQTPLLENNLCKLFDILFLRKREKSLDRSYSWKNIINKVFKKKMNKLMISNENE
jgi:hypothetical protein